MIVGISLPDSSASAHNIATESSCRSPAERRFGSSGLLSPSINVKWNVLGLISIRAIKLDLRYSCVNLLLIFDSSFAIFSLIKLLLKESTIAFISSKC